MIIPISRDEASELLANSRIGRLGCADEKGPYVVPVNYVFDGENIYVHSMPGRKLAALQANPKACLQVDEIIDEYHWRSAIAFGTYQDVTDPVERSRAVRTLLARFPHLTPVESVPVHDGQSSVILFRIHVEEVTGVGER